MGWGDEYWLGSNEVSDFMSRTSIPDKYNLLREV